MDKAFHLGYDVINRIQTNQAKVQDIFIDTVYISFDKGVYGFIQNISSWGSCSDAQWPHKMSHVSACVSISS